VSNATRPAFARDYPDDAELMALLDLFNAGNYGGVREGAARIASSEKADTVKRAARDLRSRTEPSRFQLLLLAVAALLVAFLSIYEVVRHSAQPRPAKPPIERTR
jgi:hypothetical protein